MTEQQQETRDELLTRFEVVEMMVKEGRRSTEYWGWCFVLWGAAYLIAIGWSIWSPRPDIAWPVTMIAAAVITISISSRKRRRPQTATSRAIAAAWIAVGSALFVYCFSTMVSGHGELHAFLAAIETLLGVANCASAIILRWRGQFVIALVWWISAVATCFVSLAMVTPILVAATLIGNIGFGLYLMYCESRDRHARVQHA